jgi:hypothetical protein
VDPLAQAWEHILAAVPAEGPPEDPDSVGVGGGVGDPVGVLRVAGAPVPVGDLVGPAVAREPMPADVRMRSKPGLDPAP